MKSLRYLSVLLLAGAVVAPPASAAVTVGGGPLTGLNPAGATIQLTLTNFPSSGGLYIQECLVTTGRPTPAQCNPASAVWVSTATGATFKPTDTISIPVLGAFGSVNCLTQGCGLFIRMDHTAPLNTSEDRTIPITFTGQAVKPVDEITTKVNGVLLATSGALLAYKTPMKLDITTKSGVDATVAVTGDCSVTGKTVTALKASGICDVAVTSAGNANYTGLTVHYLLTMTPAVQTFDFNAPKQIVGTKLLFVAKATTNMGEKPTVVISPSSVCALKTVGKNVMVVAKSKGTCTVTFSAPAKEGFYSAYSKTYTFTVKAKG